MEKVVLTLGGAAGQGLISVSDLLLKLLARSGFHLYASQDYMSRVRGGHNFIQVTFGAAPIHAKQSEVHLLAALDKRTIDEHFDTLSRGGVLLCDADAAAPPPGNGRHVLSLPAARLAKEAGSPLFAGTVLLGGIASLIGLDERRVMEETSAYFAKKGDAVAQCNVAAARAGYGYIADHFAAHRLSVPVEKKQPRMLVNGAQTIGLGMIAGGLRFISAYPMSPSTSIFNYVTGHARTLGILSEQAEDEIAAVNMALGASAAGARSAVTTSGGGLDLMAEGISLAGIAEIPVLIANIMRPGPGTGLPTRTGQEDLDLVLNIGHGEFPRFVFAPGTAEEAFYTALHGMNVADKYQVPVFLLGDQQLVDSYVTLDGLNMKTIPFKSYLDTGNGNANYVRYGLTATGVSPRLPYGTPGALVMYDSHIHEENGHITEDIAISRKMVEKRFRKLKGMAKEPFGPRRYGAHGAAVTLLCWGSTYGAAREAVETLNAEGTKAALVHFNRLAPFPADEARVLLRGAKGVHVVEGNYQSQFARLLARETGIVTAGPVLRYDGRPFTARDIINGIGGGKPAVRRSYGHRKPKPVSL